MWVCARVHVGMCWCVSWCVRLREYFYFCSHIYLCDGAGGVLVCACVTHTHTQTHTHKHTHIHTHTYTGKRTWGATCRGRSAGRAEFFFSDCCVQSMYIYICICVCACIEGMEANQTWY